MTYEALVNIFKAASDAYAPTLPLLPLNFHYDRVWYNNADANNKYPSMLFERSPDFEFTGLQSNGNVGLQTFEGKLFFYDVYHEEERGTDVNEHWRKQSRLNDLAIQIIGDINGLNAAANGRRIDWGKGFLAMDVHNPSLVQVTIPFTVTLKVACAI
jgi:hypothetical protein